MASLHEYRENPDGTLSDLRDTTACCESCGSAATLWEYKEYPDGTLVPVRDTGVCCGCSTDTLREYREYPDGTLVFSRDTGACCVCGGSITPGDCICTCGVVQTPDQLCVRLTNGWSITVTKISNRCDYMASGTLCGKPVTVLLTNDGCAAFIGDCNWHLQVTNDDDIFEGFAAELCVLNCSPFALRRSPATPLLSFPGCAGVFDVQVDAGAC